VILKLDVHVGEQDVGLIPVVPTFDGKPEDDKDTDCPEPLVSVKVTGPALLKA